MTNKGNGKRYDEAFMKETVRYLVENNKTVAQVARETGVNGNTLHNWVKKYSKEPDVKSAQTFTSSDAQVKALQKQLRDLEEENEILKKAMHYFAKSHR